MVRRIRQSHGERAAVGLQGARARTIQHAADRPGSRSCRDTFDASLRCRDAAQGIRSDHAGAGCARRNVSRRTRSRLSEIARLFGVDENSACTVEPPELEKDSGARDERQSPHDECRDGGEIMLTEKDSEIGAIAAIGPLGDPPVSKYERLVARAKQVPAATTIVAHPCDETSLRGADRGGGSRHHRSDSRRSGGKNFRRGSRASSRYRPLRDRRCAP